MSLSNATETDMLRAILKGQDPSWRAGATQWLALFTADPGEAGTAITNEAAHGSYARQALTKSSGWNEDSGSTFSNAGLVQWPTCTSGSETITHWGIVTTSSGAGQLILRAALTSSIPVSTGVQPQAAAGALTVTID